MSPAVEKLLARGDVVIFLKKLIEGKVDTLSPRLSKTGEIVYLDEPELAGQDNSRLFEILETLFSEGLMSREITSPAFNCPNCNETTHNHVLVCPNCHGTNLLIGTAVQHVTCLNFDFESNFEHRGGVTVCPKCHRDLSKPGVDYLTPGTYFKCLNCSEFSARALRLYTCQACHSISETAKEAPIQVYQYRVIGEAFKVIAEHLLNPDGILLTDALKSIGLEVRASNILKGRSGVEHPFTLVASYPGIEDRSKSIVIDAISSQERVGISAVISLFGKAVDCGAKHRVLVAIPQLEFDAKVFARRYKISFIEVKNHLTKEAVGRLQSALAQNSIQSVNSSAGAKSLRELSGQTKKIKSQRKRSSLDIMADILKIVSESSSKTEIMACANLSYDQCQKYIPALEKLGLLVETCEDGIHYQFTITEKGREFLSRVSAEFGRIAEGDETVWNARRRAQSYGNNRFNND